MPGITLNTPAEIRAFQKKHGLVVDGIVGPQTRKVLAEVNRPIATSARKEPDKAGMKSAPPAPVSTTRPAAAASITLPVLAKTARPLREIIFHCTATPEGRWFDRADVNAWHKQRGWSMIGYHFLILLDGTIQIGRPIGMTGSHCAGHNTGTIGVSYIGGLSKDGKVPKDTRTGPQKAAALALCKALKKTYGITARVKGHNEYAAKACPSFRVDRDDLGKI